MAVAVDAPSTTQDLHTFLDAYEKLHPDDIVHIEQPLDAAWEITALANKLEKAKRFPIVVCHNVIVDGQRSDMPLVTLLIASRPRLAEALGTDTRNSGIACFE